MLTCVPSQCACSGCTLIRFQRRMPAREPGTALIQAICCVYRQEPGLGHRQCGSRLLRAWEGYNTWPHRDAHARTAVQPISRTGTPTVDAPRSSASRTECMPRRATKQLHTSWRSHSAIQVATSNSASASDLADLVFGQRPSKPSAHSVTFLRVRAGQHSRCTHPLHSPTPSPARCQYSTYIESGPLVAATGSDTNDASHCLASGHAKTDPALQHPSHTQQAAATWHP